MAIAAYNVIQIFVNRNTARAPLQCGAGGSILNKATNILDATELWTEKIVHPCIVNVNIWSLKKKQNGCAVANGQ